MENALFLVGKSTFLSDHGRKQANACWCKYMVRGSHEEHFHSPCDTGKALGIIPLAAGCTTPWALAAARGRRALSPFLPQLQTRGDRGNEEEEAVPIWEKEVLPPGKLSHWRLGWYSWWATWALHAFLHPDWLQRLNPDLCWIQKNPIQELFHTWNNWTGELKKIIFHGLPSSKLWLLQFLHDRGSSR